MRIRLAIEWFLNPDHLPFIVGIEEGMFERAGIDLEIIEPTEHYDGLEELRKGEIAFATNEPLHLIEQFDASLLTLGTYFETSGGVLLKRSSYEKLKRGERIIVTSPVTNPTTDAIAYEIVRRYCAKAGVHIEREQVEIVANGFEHLKHMQAGADAGWLYFYNFEGIEAQHAGMDVLYLDAKNAGFANFCALDIFINRRWYDGNKDAAETFIDAVKASISWIEAHPDEAMRYYYTYTQTERSALMDDILTATMQCFKVDFSSSASQQEPILEFFTEIGITDLPREQFEKAFLA
jgi:putative hydroxymethylpyrimidine transport system substrate-binding protein